MKSKTLGELAGVEDVDEEERERNRQIDAMLLNYIDEGLSYER